MGQYQARCTPQAFAAGTNFGQVLLYKAPSVLDFGLDTLALSPRGFPNPVLELFRDMKSLSTC